MKLLQYAEMQPTHFESEQVKGIAARVLIGKNDGAQNFCMRIFEIAAGGNTPMHSHDWEHECSFIQAQVSSTAMVNGIAFNQAPLCSFPAMKTINCEIPVLSR